MRRARIQSIRTQSIRTCLVLKVDDDESASKQCGTWSLAYLEFFAAISRLIGKGDFGDYNSLMLLV